MYSKLLNTTVFLVFFVFLLELFILDKCEKITKINNNDLVMDSANFEAKLVRKFNFFRA